MAERTPLIIAVQNRDATLVRTLLTGGANPDKTDRMTGYSARDYAKRDTRAGTILKLLEAPRAKPAAVAGPKPLERDVIASVGEASQ